MSRFSCKDKCKKTSQLKDSEFCTGFCTVEGGMVIYDCDIKIKNMHNDEKNFLSCGIWDMGVRDNCSICPLECKENKNPIVQKTKNAMKNMSAILSSLSPIMSETGIDINSISKAKSMMESGEINTNNYKEIEEAVNLTNYAKNVINSIMNGKGANISEIKLIKESLEKKYKR